MEATALTGDAASAVAALERLRDGGFAVATITVGAVAITLHRAAGARDHGDERPAPGGILEEFGGEVFRQLAGEHVKGAEYQPAIGRRDG